MNSSHTQDVQDNCIVILLDDSEDDSERGDAIEKAVKNIIGKNNVKASVYTEWPSRLARGANQQLPIIAMTHWTDLTNQLLVDLEDGPRYLDRLTAIVAYSGEGPSAIEWDSKHTKDEKKGFRLLRTEGKDRQKPIAILSIQRAVSRDGTLLEKEINDILSWCFLTDREDQPLPAILSASMPWLSIAKLLLQGYIVARLPHLLSMTSNKLIELAEKNKQHVRSEAYWQSLAKAFPESPSLKNTMGILARLKTLLENEQGLKAVSPKSRKLDDDVAAIWEVLCK